MGKRYMNKLLLTLLIVCSLSILSCYEIDTFETPEPQYGDLAVEMHTDWIGCINSIGLYLDDEFLTFISPGERVVISNIEVGSYRLRSNYHCDNGNVSATTKDVTIIHNTERSVGYYKGQTPCSLYCTF